MAKINPAAVATIIDIKNTKTNPDINETFGRSTFIPQKLANIVGIAKIIVIDVNLFITTFRLFEIIVGTSYYIISAFIFTDMVYNSDNIR